ncbi:MAG: hypothetical protein KZQ80_08710 [Candidatus Thiodiazotropha sp. (ex Monitilora ramsayi)]|nr:hypothetical protein [Candidatus Thiodiazotropha sp. (ex Monitilora ramsayi)]
MESKAHHNSIKQAIQHLPIIAVICLLGLFSKDAKAPPFWDPPVMLTPANAWTANLTRQPTLIYADPQGQASTLTWSAHGNTWRWDGTQWHYQGLSGSLNINSFTIIGMVPTSSIMYYDAILVPVTACVPTTCQSQGRNCGSIPDGCGGTLFCGTCGAGLSCGGGGMPGVCGSPASACTPGSWMLSTVDSAGDVGRRSTIAVESGGRIHIVYYDVDNHRLKHAAKDPAGNWTIEIVEVAANFEDYAETALAIDIAGGLHLSYQRRFITGGEELRYAYRSPATGWGTPVTVEAGGRTGFGTDLLIDNGGGLHLSYHRMNPDEIRYRYRPPGGGWQTPEIVGWGYGDTALDRDPGGGMHFSYSNSSGLYYRFREPGGNWRSEELVSDAGQPINRDLALDSQDGVHLAYQGFSGQTLDHAYRTPGTPPTGGLWSRRNLDNSGNLGSYISMDLDSADRVHIAYRDHGNDDLKYIGSTLQGTWNAPVVVDAQGQVANYGIGLDYSAGQVYVSYFDWTQGDLKIAIGCP